MQDQVALAMDAIKTVQEMEMGSGRVWRLSPI